MIKGKVTIDLHNHRSGFTERIEKENMVTDALKHWMNCGIISNENARPNNFMPVAQRALGALMLFDNSIVEDANNYQFPGAESHLVGYAKTDVNTANKIRGSYNNIESGANDSGFTSVWDFSTSQCNGKIKALARTFNYDADGMFSMRGSKYRIRELYTNKDDSIIIPLCYNDAEQKIYVLNNEVDSVVASMYMPIDKYKVNDFNGEISQYDTKTMISLPSEFRNYGRKFFRNGYDGYAYMTYNMSNENGNGVLKYRRIKLSDYSFELSDETEIVCQNCHFKGGTNLVSNTSAFYNSCIVKGYAFVVNYAGTGIYVINLSNTADIHEYALPEGYSIGNWSGCEKAISALPNGAVAVTVGHPTGHYNMIMYNDGTMLIDTSYSTSVTELNRLIRPAELFHNGMSFNYRLWGSSICGCYLGGMLLGTICNLPSEINKTAEQSMKITYTLTDV